VKEKLPHKGLTEPGRRNSTEGMNWNKGIRTSIKQKLRVSHKFGDLQS
jgi:hypothetical protein